MSAWRDSLPEPAAKLGRWSIYPSSEGDLIFRVDDSDFFALLTVCEASDSLLRQLTACCGGLTSRRGEESFCYRCAEPYPVGGSNGLYVGDWEGGLHLWLDGYNQSGGDINPL